MNTPTGKKGRYFRPSLSGQVEADLGSKIVSGRFAEGEVLPTEAALGTKLGVSRTGIREAIKVLSSKGLVEVRRKTGTRVRPRRDWNALDPDVIAWQFSDATSPALMDLLELRKVIEPACAAMAAERATEADLEHLAGGLAEMKLAVGKTAASSEADLRFHLAILEATHNAFMRPFGALIQAALRASFRLTNANPTAYKQSLVRHEAVLLAIQSGSAKLAEASMRSILENTQVDIERAIRLASRASTTGVKAGRSKLQKKKPLSSSRPSRRPRYSSGS